MFGLRSRKEEGWLAVDVQAERIDIAHVLRLPGRRPRINRLESYARSAEPAQALAILRRQKGLGRYRCTTLLEPGDYQMLQVDAPEVPETELREAVRWRLKDLLEYPADQATVDVLRLPVKPASGRAAQLIAVAAKDTVLTPCIRVFDDAGLDLQAIDVPEMAQRNIAALFEDENRGLVMLSIGPSGGLLTITYAGELCVTRNMDITIAQFEAADESRRAQLVERIGLDLQRSLDNIERLYTMMSVSKVVVAPCPAAPGLVEALREFVYVPVEPIDLASALDCAAAPELRQPALQAARLALIGAALRDPPKGGRA